ncbi:MAG TPA: CpaD family pilus assembly protein [Xanthobacteraceae bacterium]|jgi:pilus assembly protein CpaD|nr:CpaD family pilus assembly protein [Xanthobacteraceae bacterium]
MAIAGCAATLAGCVSDQAGMPEYPPDLRHRHPIAIREGVHTVELFIGSRRGELTLDQRADVLSFAHSWKRDAAGGVIIDMPTGTSNEAAAANVLPEVRSILVSMGVPAQSIGIRTYQPSDPRTLATMRLNYPRMVASAGPCGMWPHDLGPTIDREHSDNLEYWNFGCAAQHNLAAQVANPADLVQPRGETPAYNQRRTKAMEAYRQGMTPATVYTITNNNEGKISDIGK